MLLETRDVLSSEASLTDEGYSADSQTLVTVVIGFVLRHTGFRDSLHLGYKINNKCLSLRLDDFGFDDK